MRGSTLLELLIAVAIIGTLLVIAAPRFSAWGDRLAAERAARDLALFYHQARTAALFRGSRVRLEFDQRTLRAVFEGVTDSTFLERPGPARHGVTLSASRTVIRIYSNGLGLGAANTKLVVRRGQAAESLTTSRLGRLKRWN